MSKLDWYFVAGDAQWESYFSICLFLIIDKNV